MPPLGGVTLAAATPLRQRSCLLSPQDFVLSFILAFVFSCLRTIGVAVLRQNCRSSSRASRSSAKRAPPCRTNSGLAWLRSQPVTRCCSGMSSMNRDGCT